MVINHHWAGFRSVHQHNSSLKLVVTHPALRRGVAFVARTQVQFVEEYAPLCDALDQDLMQIDALNAQIEGSKALLTPIKVESGQTSNPPGFSAAVSGAMREEQQASSAESQISQQAIPNATVEHC